MIRSAIWGWSLTTIRISAIPSGTYQVYLTVWEDNNNASFDIRLEGSLVRGGYQSGSGGRWERLGPWPATITRRQPRPHRRPRRQPLRHRALAERLQPTTAG